MIRGYEKVWNIVFGAGMGGAATVFALWGFAEWTGRFEAPPGEALAAAIATVVASLFNAANVYFTANTEPEPKEPDQ
jgi:hypothetical protein